MAPLARPARSFTPVYLNPRFQSDLPFDPRPTDTVPYHTDIRRRPPPVGKNVVVGDARYVEHDAKQRSASEAYYVVGPFDVVLPTLRTNSSAHNTTADSQKPVVWHYILWTEIPARGVEAGSPPLTNGTAWKSYPQPRSSTRHTASASTSIAISTSAASESRIEIIPFTTSTTTSSFPQLSKRAISSMPTGMTQSTSSRMQASVPTRFFTVASMNNKRAFNDSNVTGTVPASDFMKVLKAEDSSRYSATFAWIIVGLLVSSIAAAVGAWIWRRTKNRAFREQLKREEERRDKALKLAEQLWVNSAPSAQSARNVHPALRTKGEDEGPPQSDPRPS